MNKSNLKKYKFSVNTLFSDNDITVKRVDYKNTLYLYIYKKSVFRDRAILGLKVTVCTRK